MLSIHQHSELATPALWDWLLSFVYYDTDGRDSRWLVTGEPLHLFLREVSRVIMPDVHFSGVLLQAYKHGHSVTPCHTDAGGTGKGFTLSLGAPRTFRAHRTRPGISGCADYNLDRIQIQCVNGTVLLMDEEFHTNWHHQIVSDSGITEEKLSLVFRTSPRTT